MSTSPVVFSSFFRSSAVWANAMVGTAALTSAANRVDRSIRSPPLSIGGNCCCCSPEPAAACEETIAPVRGDVDGRDTGGTCHSAHRRLPTARRRHDCVPPIPLCYGGCPKRSYPGHDMPAGLRLALVAAVALAASNAGGADRIRVAVQRTGTLAWELDVIKAHGLDRKLDLAIETTELASTEAGKIALKGGSAVLMLSDWLWVAR